MLGHINPFPAKYMFGKFCFFLDLVIFNNSENSKIIYFRCTSNDDVSLINKMEIIYAIPQFGHLDACVLPFSTIFFLHRTFHNPLQW